MENTSAGYHTFSFYQKLDEMDYMSLIDAFRIYERNNSDIMGFPLKDEKGRYIGWEYCHKKNKGIQWRLLSSRTPNGFMLYGITAIINPKALIKGNYITAAQEDDLEAIEEIYNNEAAKISRILSGFGERSVNRADFCVNIDLKELGIPCSPEMMMKLIRRGNIPNHYKEFTEYNKEHHRKTPYKNSFYLKSKSVNINYYNKYSQQDERHPNYSFRELSRHMIRFEVQCKYPKLYPIAKGIKHQSKFHALWDALSPDEQSIRFYAGEYKPSIPVDVVLADKISEQINQKYFYRIIGNGDYFTLDIAREIVKSYHFRSEKEERMLYALELVEEHHGITKAKSRLHGPDLDDFKKSLRDLDSILVNPVTIPRRWGIKHIPHLLKAYNEAGCEEVMISEQEYMARKHIDEILRNE